MAAKTGKTKLGFEDAVAAMAVLQPKLEDRAAAFKQLSQDAAAAAKSAAAAKAATAKAGRDLRDLRAREKVLQRIVDRGPPREAPVRGKVENPKRADGLVEQQLEDGTAAALIKEGRFAGLVDVDIRLSTRIGGLSRIKERDEFQTMAAARYRSLWDQAQIGGAQAIDYERVRVDTSGSSVDVVTSMGEDARRHYAEAVQKLGICPRSSSQLTTSSSVRRSLTSNWEESSSLASGTA